MTEEKLQRCLKLKDGIDKMKNHLYSAKKAKDGKILGGEIYDLTIHNPDFISYLETNLKRLEALYEAE
jgi:hypothetical protein